MAKECVNCVHKSDFKADECGTCMVSYMDGLQHGLPSNFKPKPMTNADRIRAMSDEELAVLLSEFCKGMEFCDHCVAKKDCPGESPVCWEKWLKQPAEVDHDKP